MMVFNSFLYVYQAGYMASPSFPPHPIPPSPRRGRRVAASPHRAGADAAGHRRLHRRRDLRPDGRRSAHRWALGTSLCHGENHGGRTAERMGKSEDPWGLMANEAEIGGKLEFSDFWLVVWNMNFICPYIGNHTPN